MLPAVDLVDAFVSDRIRRPPMNEALALAPVPPPAVVNHSALWVRARHVRRLSAAAAVSRIITAGQIGVGLFGIVLLVVLGAQVETWPVFTPTVQYGAWMMGAIGLAAAAILAMTRRHN